MRTYIIAEAGVNHNGDIKTAKQLVDVAAEAGADAVKFQTFKAERLVSKGAPKAKYQVANAGNKESQFEMLKKLELSEAGHRQLLSYCEDKGCEFMSTPFDEESSDFLDEFGMTTFKIPSGEITNKPLIRHIARKGKPIILSTGMSTLGEVEKAVGWIDEEWTNLSNNPQLTLLHCVSSYPAPFEETNLMAMKTMEMAFGCPVGYSDHTMGIEIPVAAVAVGAKVIEKHFTLDRNMEGPDHKASLEPSELKAMVSAIRNVEKAMGDGIKRLARCEEDTKNVARKSIVITRDIKKGDMVSLEDIIIKRPGTGIQPEFKDLIVGMKAKRDMKADSILSWDDFKDA